MGLGHAPFRRMSFDGGSIDQCPSDKFRDAIVYLYPEDVIEYHKQVRAQGLAVPELNVTFYGLTEFRINDPDGNRLWIGQNTACA